MHIYIYRAIVVGHVNHRQHGSRDIETMQLIRSLQTGTQPGLPARSKEVPKTIKHT